ncbi:E3 ubiquitin/ISG15 ligase TRIM25-like [Eleutherodactylus coqui]|uniref:E3 ubiquitin/ISG15 ligase TRIM25-like n=1 Tax=Eleutherodactylus coqui TaxID=57060 RepID=UPI0034622CCE
MMASADLRDELNCSICLSLYTDPVSLRCGHNFCRSCIVSALDAQEAAGVYSCPYCREESPQRPALEKKRKLANIVERFLSSPPDMESRIFCTYCIKSPVPAVRTCLHCETSLCDDHLAAHNKTADHILTDPTSSFGNKKCSVHKKVLEYYCPQDAACLCVTCCLLGKHRGHQVELLGEASKKKKEKLRKYLGELNPQKAELQTRVQNLQGHKKNIQEKVSKKRKNIRKLFMDMKEQLEMAEKKVQSEISRQEDEIVSQISHLIKELAKEEKELSVKMHHMEQMCHVTDPIRLLQERDITDNGTDPTTVLQELDQGAACRDKSAAAEKEAPVHEATKKEKEEEKLRKELDEDLISLILHRSMRDIVTSVTSGLGFQVPDILLDEDTACIGVELSADLKTATYSEEVQQRPESPRRFLYYRQVLSRCGLSYGRHYWEVAWNQVGVCMIGVSYPSIKRKGEQSVIGSNDKSWCLDLDAGYCGAYHNAVLLPCSIRPTCPTFGVFLDYEAGRLSFYALCDPIRHLHTFTASFTEPLHVAFYVEDGASVTITS